MTRTCAACDQPVHNQDTICSRCVKFARRRLHLQAHHEQELTVALSRQVRMSDASDGGRSAEVPVFFAPYPAALLHEQRSTLVFWCRMIVEEQIGDWPEADTVKAMAARIESCLPILRSHAAAGDLAGELSNLVARVIAAVDLPTTRHQFAAGPCPQTYTVEGSTDPCSGTVVVTVPRDEGAGKAMARCDRCKVEWEAKQWMRMGHDIARRQQELDRQRTLAESFKKGA